MSLIHVTDSEGMKPCIKLYQGDLQICPDLNLMIEEAYSNITPQLQKAVMREVRCAIYPFE